MVSTEMCIHISGFHSITSVSLDKLYQGSRNFSEQKCRFPCHEMKFTINWLLCPYRPNQRRSWTVLHSHLSYWWTVILSNWQNGEKHAQHNKKQDLQMDNVIVGMVTSYSHYFRLVLQYIFVTVAMYQSYITFY